MIVKDLIKRALAGDVLNASEKAELENFDPDALLNELNSTRGLLETLENEKLSHSERLQKELDSLKMEHDKLNGIHRELQRQYRIEKFADEFGCTDAGYFDFLTRKNNIDLDNREAVAEFARELAKNSPGCFQARITPGSCTPFSEKGLPANPRNDMADIHVDRIGRIMDKLNSANAAEL